MKISFSDSGELRGVLHELYSESIAAGLTISITKSTVMLNIHADSTPPA